MKTKINLPIAEKVLVAVRNYSKEVSNKGNVYYKIELQSFASKASEGWVESKTLSKVNVSETFFRLWLKDKLSASNMLLLSIEHHIKGVTEYVDTDDKVQQHSEDGVDVKEALQATVFDLIDINESVDISKYLPYMVKAIEAACVKQAVSNRLY